MKLRCAYLVVMLLALHAVDSMAAVLYVDLNNSNPVSPYSSWSTAATNIQDAVDAASSGDTVLVTNGVYATGGTMAGLPITNRVAVTQSIALESVNGPTVTVIQGFQMVGTTNGSSAVRCVFLTNGASLSGFTLTNGATETYGNGGGVKCGTTGEVVSNCLIIGNSSGQFGAGAYAGTLYSCSLTSNTTYVGGGAAYSVLYHCTLNSNIALNSGGGASSSQLNNCVVAGNSSMYGGGTAMSMLNYCNLTVNSASYGGGDASSLLTNCLLASNTASTEGGGANMSFMANCTVVANSTGLGGKGGGAFNCNLTNCIVYYNTSPSFPNYNPGPATYSCTTPLPSSGSGNTTNAPLFVNLTTDDFHLQSTSPCINSGNNAYMTNSTDLDGNPRISGGTVDMGAYEYQNPSSIISYAWLLQYGLATDGTADFSDPDQDGANNYQEWRAGTNPTNAASALLLAKPAASGTNIVVTWQSVINHGYYLQRSTNLDVSPAFQPLATNLVGKAGTTSYTDTAATNAGPYYYRVGVQ